MNRLATAAATVLAAASLAACGGGHARPSAAPNDPPQSRAAAAQPSAVTPNAAQPDRVTAQAPRKTPKPKRKAAAPNRPGGAVVVRKQNAANLVRSILQHNRQQRPRSPGTSNGPLAQVLKALNKGGKKPAPASKPSKSGSALVLPGLSGSK